LSCQHDRGLDSTTRAAYLDVHHNRAVFVKADNLEFMIGGHEVVEQGLQFCTTIAECLEDRLFV